MPTPVASAHNQGDLFAFGAKQGGSDDISKRKIAQIQALTAAKRSQARLAAAMLSAGRDREY